MQPERRFLPGSRGWKFSGEDRPQPDAILKSPRLQAYLEGLRCVDRSLCSALDHALLELLITAAVDDDPKLQADAYLVRFSDVRALLDRSDQSGRTRILQSLDRLTRREFTLPPLPRRRSRRRLRLPPSLPIRCAQLFREAEELLEREALERFEMDFETAAEQGQPAVLDLLRCTEARFGIAYHEPSADDQAAEFSQARIWDGFLGSTHVRANGPACTSTDRRRDEPVRFQPLKDFRLYGEGLKFRLAEPLRRFLDLSRQEKGRFLPFGYIDVRRLAGFRCRYSAPLLRSLMADTGSWEDYCVRRGRRRFSLRRPRIGVWQVTLSLDEVASCVSYAWTSGSRRAQLTRNVLGIQNGSVVQGKGARALADLATGHINDLLVTAKVAGDKVHFELRYLPDLRELRSRPIDPPDDHSQPPPGSSSELVKLRTWENRSLRLRQRERLTPVDEQTYSVRLSTWHKVADRFGFVTRTELEQISEAWRLAIDEMLHTGVEHYGDLTGNLQSRLFRGGQLRTLIEREGPDRALFWFALEERDSPDLLDPVAKAILDHDGTSSYVQSELARRQARLLGRPECAPKERQRQLDGLDGVICEVQRLLEKRRLAGERELDELGRRRAEKREAARQIYNRVRRKDRAEVRQERGERREAALQRHEYDYLNHFLEQDQAHTQSPAFIDDDLGGEEYDEEEGEEFI